MIYITGDTHADWRRFSTDNFPEQKEMTRDDFVIICGDFGIWHDDVTERYWLDWFSKKNPTFLFVDGNHENFDRLYGDEFRVVDFHGGRAHKIRENVYHLMRGYVFDLCGKKFFAFGGAMSHDIDDGILNPEDYDSMSELLKDYRKRTATGEMLRINHLSWWRQEMPSKEEMDRGIASLEKNNNKVDFIVSHCCPQSIASMCGYREPDKLTQYFNIIAETVSFNKWFFGHYHDNRNIMLDFVMLYEQIIRIV